MSNSPKTLLRRELRARRNSLSPFQQKQASQKLCRVLKKQAAFLRSKHIAFYLAEDGEIDSYELLLQAHKMGKKCYLPVLNPFNTKSLWFARYEPGDQLLLNHFSIAEPPAEKACFPAWALDLVLMPLVGFDRKGSRLGMGGGFYDRTFSFLNDYREKKMSKPGSPTLMGLAHNCQEEAFLTCEEWDIPLHYVATDLELIKVN